MKNRNKSFKVRFFNKVKISNYYKIFKSFIIITLLIFLSSCDNDPNEILIFKDKNFIRSEGKGDYYMTTRNLDGKSNVYTKEKIYFFFSKRNYKLRNWTTIKYSENGAYGSYLLFKDFKGQDPNGLQCEINRNSHFGKLGSMLTEIENYKNSHNSQLNNDQRFDLEMLLAGTGALELTLQYCEGEINAL